MEVETAASADQVSDPEVSTDEDGDASDINMMMLYPAVELNDQDEFNDDEDEEPEEDIPVDPVRPDSVEISPITSKAPARAAPSKVQVSVTPVKRPDHDGSRLTCHICNIDFSTPSNLRKHQKIKHSGTKDFDCPKCEYKAPLRYYLKRHLKSAHNEEMLDFKCGLCNYATDQRWKLKQHFETNHISNETAEATLGELYNCKMCDFTATNAADLKVDSLRGTWGGGDIPNCRPVSISESMHPILYISAWSVFNFATRTAFY